MKNLTKIVAGSLAGGLILGSVGFIGGFFGPLIFAPGANQGPLLGIFITGPLGFLIGCIVGGFATAYWPPMPPVRQAIPVRK